MVVSEFPKVPGVVGLDKFLFQILHRNIDYVEKHCLGDKGGTLTIKCKDLSMLRMEIMTAEEFASVADSIEKLSAIGNEIHLTSLRSILRLRVTGM